MQRVENAFWEVAEDYERQGKPIAKNSFVWLRSGESLRLVDPLLLRGAAIREVLKLN